MLVYKGRIKENSRKRFCKYSICLIASTHSKAKEKAWAEFKRRYPRADLTKFAEASIDDSDNVTADVMFEAGPDGLMQSVSGSDP